MLSTIYAGYPISFDRLKDWIFQRPISEREIQRTKELINAAKSVFPEAFGTWKWVDDRDPLVVAVEEARTENKLKEFVLREYERLNGCNPVGEVASQAGDSTGGCLPSQAEGSKSGGGEETEGKASIG